MSFEKLQIIPPIKKALEEQGYREPTPIQSQVIPIVLSKKDLVGCARTGTGKTAAFAIPILQILHQLQQEMGNTRETKHTLKALILTPTRELAMQIADNIKAYGKHLHIKHSVVFGGVPQLGQVSDLRAGVDILVATPGRLIDLVWQKYIDFGDVKILVLDEADRMLDMGFAPDVKQIIEFLPPKRLNLLFSATMPKEIENLVNSILHEPVRVNVDPVSSTVDTVEQVLYRVNKQNKKDLLVHLIQKGQLDSALVFMRTKHGADRLAMDLKKENMKVAVIHGDKSQSEREYALNRFKKRTIRVLLATDIAARGLDIDDISHVINYDVPDQPESYVHRIGRTARAGAKGMAITFSHPGEQRDIKQIEALIGKKLTVKHDHPFAVSSRRASSKRSRQRKRPDSKDGGVSRQSSSKKQTNRESGSPEKSSKTASSSSQRKSRQKRSYSNTAKNKSYKKQSTQHQGGNSSSNSNNKPRTEQKRPTEKQKASTGGKPSSKVHAQKKTVETKKTPELKKTDGKKTSFMKKMKNRFGLKKSEE